MVMRVLLNLQLTSAMLLSGNQKTILRTELKKQRASVSNVEKSYIDRLIAGNVISSDLFEHAHVVFVYCSTVHEIDTYSIISACLTAGKIVCVPFCEKEPGIMTARRIHSLSDLSAGKHGISEPSADAECVPANLIDLCIIPCLAADLSGYRLGYGGGYYDRFLTQVQCEKMVLCAESRLLRAVPREDFDVPCDYICTERRILIRETYKT